MDPRGEALLQEALGWISDIMADDGTRDGDPPTGAEISAWAEQWIQDTQDWLNIERTEV